MNEHDGRHTLARLLGPAQPEVGCDACFALIDRFVEAELAGGETEDAFRGLRPHLDGCPACREEYVALRALVSEP
jgi:hypothetical protein